jgi:hypothetical protein
MERVHGGMVGRLPLGPHGWPRAGACNRDGRCLDSWGAQVTDQQKELSRLTERIRRAIVNYETATRQSLKVAVIERKDAEQQYDGITLEATWTPKSN